MPCFKGKNTQIMPITSENKDNVLDDIEMNSNSHQQVESLDLKDGEEIPV